MPAPLAPGSERLRGVPPAEVGVGRFEQVVHVQVPLAHDSGAVAVAGQDGGQRRRLGGKRTPLSHSPWACGQRPVITLARAGMQMGLEV